MIYLASPYSHMSLEVRSERARKAAKAAGQLIKKGEIVYSPVAQGHMIVCSGIGLPTDWEYWKKNCEEFIRKADRFMVLTINGWSTSTGVLAEIEYAKSVGLKIEYVEIE